MAHAEITAPATWRERFHDLPLSTLVIPFALALLLTMTLAVTIGPVELSMTLVWRVAIAKMSGGTADWSLAQENIVWMLRFPRVLLAALVGGGLAVVGVTMQAVVRNPLADPYVLGISSGTSVGTVLVLSLGWFGALGI